VSSKTVEQAAESASLTRHRFEQGLAIPTQLIDSETALVAVRVRRAEAESDQRIAIAALRKALALPQLEGHPTAK
jgi:outer membrane protein TolC